MLALQSILMKKGIDDGRQGAISREKKYESSRPSPSGSLSEYSDDMPFSSVRIAVVQAFWQQVSQTYSDMTSQIEALLRHIGLRHILIPEPGELRCYLLRHPDIVDLVRFACESAWDQFAPRAQLSLEVYRDPEIEDQYLTLYVRQEHYDEHILDEIEDVRRGYEDSLSDRSGWLLVTTDFQPPR